MENLTQNETQSVDTVQITDSLKQELLSSAKWGKFIAIAGFVMVGLLFLFTLFFNSLFSSFSTVELDDDMMSMSAVSSMTATSTIISLILSCLVGFFVCFFLLKASNGIINGLNNNQQMSFAQGVHNLKILSTLYGVLTIIGVAIFVVSLLFIALVGALV